MSQAATKGPNYDWKHEAKHYEAECDKLRALLDKVDAQGERDAWERDKLHTALESLADIVDDSLLLDEALAEDWDKLRNAVVEARKIFGGQMTQLLDKNGIQIEEFDVLKVFHFIGARKKKHYMYKVAVLYNGELYGSHIESNPLKPNYPLRIKGAHLENTEIVQSLNWEKLDKPRRKNK